MWNTACIIHRFPPHVENLVESVENHGENPAVFHNRLVEKVERLQFVKSEAAQNPEDHPKSPQPPKTQQKHMAENKKCLLSTKKEAQP